MLRLLPGNPLSISGHQAFLIPRIFPQNEISKPVVWPGPGSAPYIVSYLSSRLKASGVPDSALSLLNHYGFSEDQTEVIFHKAPKIAAGNTEKTIKQKLDCFLAFGYSPTELIDLVCSTPQVLHLRLVGRIVHNLNLLEKILGSKELVKKAVSYSNRLLHADLEKTLIPKLNTLKEIGVSPENIVFALTRYPWVMTVKNDTFTKSVKKVKKLGMKPVSTLFIIGINVMLRNSDVTWERKLELYESFGWSKKDVLLAFAKQPMCMNKSEDKIKKMMNFFLEKLRIDPSYLAVCPVFFGYSLEERIIPRCAVVSVLVSKGLLNKIPAWTYLFSMSDKDFKARFVDRYVKEVPQVLDAFQGKVEFTAWFELKIKKEASTAVHC